MKSKLPLTRSVAALARMIPLVLLFSCKSEDKPDVMVGSSEADPEFIYFDYQVKGEETNDSVTILLQFRQDYANGRTLKLDPPSQVTLDGEVLKADSTKITGAFYEIQKQVDSFPGAHTIVFTGVNKTRYKETFYFQPMQLLTSLPETIPAEDLWLELSGIGPDEKVRLVLTDTVFGSEGIDRLDSLSGNRLLISREDLASLAPGPVQLFLVKETNQPIKNGTYSGGNIFSSFELRREFILTKPID